MRANTPNPIRDLEVKQAAPVLAGFAISGGAIGSAVAGPYGAMLGVMCGAIAGAAAMMLIEHPRSGAPVHRR
jgi:outer membrane lipoprotein SlyB